MSGKSPDSGELKKIGNRNFKLQGLLKIRVDRQQQQRIASEIEEIIVQPDALHAQHPLPHIGDLQLELRLPCPRPRCSHLRRNTGAGSAARSIFPLGESGSASMRTNNAGTMCAGTFAGKKLLQFFGR